MISNKRIQELIKRERKLYEEARPNTARLMKKAKEVLISGTPMYWMADAPGALPPFIKEARGCYLVDVDGNRYIDFCLGGSAAICGHSPEPVARVIADQAFKGLTTILPTEDALWVGEELTRRFGLPLWQIYLSATDANRFAIRVARKATNRDIVLIFDGCYHGTLEETLVSVDGGSKEIMGHEVMGGVSNTNTRVIPFNDLDALEKALSPRDVACVITEPALTNAGIIFPKPDFLAGLRDMTRRYGTLLLIDETHTITAGPGGLTRKWHLEPDIFTLGKPIGGGIPTGIMGITGEVAEKSSLYKTFPAGMGGTLSGNPLQIASMRANLENVLTAANYEHMLGIANFIGDFIDTVTADAGLPWQLDRIGCRLEHRYRMEPFQDLTSFMGSYLEEIDTLRRLFMANRGVWVTPVHSTLLTCPATTRKDAETLNSVFEEFVEIMA